MTHKLVSKAVHWWEEFKELLGDAFLIFLAGFYLVFFIMFLLDNIFIYENKRLIATVEIVSCLLLIWLGYDRLHHDLGRRKDNDL